MVMNGNECDTMPKLSEVFTTLPSSEAQLLSASFSTMTIIANLLKSAHYLTDFRMGSNNLRRTSLEYLVRYAAAYAHRGPVE